MKARQEQALAIGWNAEAFARSKKLKPIDHYLKPAPTPERQRDKGSREVKRMFDKMIRKQEAAIGDR